MAGIYCLLLVTLTTIILPVTYANYCDGYGHSCPAPQECCGNTCCRDKYGYSNMRWSVWNMWYFWFIVILIMMTCFGSCGYWRRRQLLLAQQHHMGTTQHHPNTVQQPYCMHYTAASAPYSRPVRCHMATMGVPVYPNYGYPVAPEALPEAQGMFPAPPPYAEVVSKPGVYTMAGMKDVLPPYQRDPTALPAQQPGGYPNRGQVPPPGQYPPNQMSLSVMAVPTAPSNQRPLHSATFQRPPAMQANMGVTPTNENAAFSNCGFVHSEDSRVSEDLMNQNSAASSGHPGHS